MQKVRTSMILGMIILLCMISTAAVASDWTKWRGPNGDNVTTYKNWDPKAIENPEKVLWRAQLGKGHSTVIVKDNLLYTLGGEFVIVG